MGRTKALVEIDGSPMAKRIAHALRAGGCSDVVLVGGDPGELAVLGLPVLDDEHPGAGPVGGVLTALHHFAGRDVVVVACDVPYLTSTTVARLLATFERGSSDAVVAYTDRVEPLCAVWRSTTVDRVQAAFDAGARAVHTVLDDLAVDRVHLDGAELRNLNEPTDLPRT